MESSLFSQGIELLAPKSVPFSKSLDDYEQKLQKNSSQQLNQGLSPEQIFINSTVYAHALLLLQKYNIVVEVSSNFSQFLNFNNGLNSYTNKYTQVMIIKHLAIVGTAYEALSQFDQSIEIYTTAVPFMSLSIGSSPGLLFWAEQLYYRFGKLAASYKWDNSELVLKALRGHEEIAGLLSQNSTTSKYYNRLDGPQRKISILNIHFIYSSAMLQSNPNSQTKEDVENLSKLFEKFLFESTEESTSSESNQNIEQFIETIMQNWRKTMKFSYPLEQVYTPEDNKETEKMLVILRRATIKTFHSCAIMRHLVFVLSALGQHKESLMAFDTYVSYQEKARLQQEKSNLSNNNIAVTSGNEPIENALSPHPTQTLVTDPPTASSSTAFGDDDKSVIRVFTKAINILVQVKHDGLKAKETADKLRSWFYTEEEASAFSKEKYVSSYHGADKYRPAESSIELSTVWFSIANAYSLFGFQAFTTAERDQSFILAVNSFEKSLFYTHGQSDAKILAGYGLFLARISKIPKSLEVVRSALLLDSNNYASWHLMALLLSSLGDYDKALNAINNTIDMIDARRDTLTTSEKSSFLQIKITHVAISEAVYGIDRALELISEVFILFGDLFPEANNPSTALESAPVNAIKVRPTSLAVSNGDLRPTVSAASSNHVSDQASLRPIFSRLSIKRLSSNNQNKKHHSLHIPHPHLHPSQSQNQKFPKPSLSLPTVNKPVSKRPAPQVLKPSDALQKKNLAELWIWAASVYRRAELYKDAEEALIEAENVNGPTPASHVELGLLILKDRPLHAMEEFESALEKDSNNLAAIIAFSQLVLDHVDLNKKLKQRQEEKRKKIEEEVQREIRLNQTNSFRDPFENVDIEEPSSGFRPYYSDDEDDEDDFENGEEEDDFSTKSEFQKSTKIANGHSRLASTTSKSQSKPDYYANDAAMDVLFLSEKDEQAAIARASGLLETLVHSGHGFNSSEAWYLLAQYLERDSDNQGSIAALWKSIGLEESRSVRDYVVSQWK